MKDKKGIRMIIGVLCFLLLLIFLFERLPSGQSKNTFTETKEEDVLAEFSASNSGSLIVNIPAEFTEDVNIRDKTLNLGNGVIIAKNIVTDLINGTGIQVVQGEGQERMIVNSDRGSDQKIFGTVRIDGTELQADSNTSVLEFEAGEGLELTIVDGKVVLKTSGTGSSSSVTNITNVTTTTGDTSGFEDTGTNIALKTPSDTVTIGTDVAQGKLTIESSSANQTGLVIEAAAGQTANLSEWRDSNGDSVITFDKEGNASFKGVISQNGFTFAGGSVNFSGSDDTVLFDVKTNEPDSLFVNGGLEANMNSWDSTTPTSSTLFSNGEFTSSTEGWTGEVEGSSFPELFSNTGFETDTSSWLYSGGGLYTFTEYDTAGSTPLHMTAGPDGNVWYATTTNKIGKITMTGVVTEYTTPSTVQNGQITSGPDGYVWYGASSTNKIGKINPATGTITEYNTASGVVGLTTGPDGNIWFAMQGADRIGSITTSGVIVNNYFFPSNDAPREIVSGPDGNLYVTFETGNQVGKLTVGGTLTVIANTGSLPRGITVGPDNNIWYTVFTGGGTGRYNVATNTNTFFSGITGNFDIVNGPSDGYMYMSRTGTRQIVRLATDGSEYVFPGTSTGQIRGITLGPDNNIWYAAETVNKIGKFTINGPQRVTTPTFALTNGALRVPAMSPAVRVTQSVNVGDSRQYTIQAHVYLDGSTPVTSSHASIVINDTPVTTTYTSMGGGWYLLTATVTGVPVATPYGVQISANTVAYVDSLSLKASSVAERVVSPSYSGAGAARVIAPGGNNATLVQSRALTAGGYTLTAYAYTNGSAVTTADIDLLYGGTALPTTISATATPGWYKLESAITVPADTVATAGVRVKAGKTVFTDALSLIPNSVSGSVVHSTSSPTSGGTAGAVRVNAIGRSNINFTQDVTVATDDTYLIRANVYNLTPGATGGAVTSDTARLILNGSVVANATITVAGSGFYTISAETYITAGTYPIGLQTLSGSRVVVDSFTMTPGAGNDKTVLISNSGSGKARLEVESTTTLNSGDPGSKALVVKGSAGQVANLTEWQDSAGTALSVINAEGHLGIGTTNPGSGLSVLQNQLSGTTASFVNLNSTDSPLGGVVRIASGVASNGVDTRFVQFYAGATSDSDGTGVGRIRLNNGGVAYESGGADFAEYFDSALSKTQYEPGDIISLTPDGTVDRSGRPYDKALVGVVSNTAAFVGNAKDEATSSAQILVGLVGQIPVKVTSLNGPINAGDPITSSELRGVGMKATNFGMILGRALEAFNPQNASECSMAASSPRDVLNNATGSALLATESANLASPSAKIKEEPLKCGTIRIYLNPGMGGEGDVLAEATTSAPLTLLDEETTVFDGGISVLGMANVTDLAVTNSISAGLLSINGLTESGNASIDTLTGSLLLQSQAQGAIELMGGRVRVSQQGDVDIREGNLKIENGVIQGNDQFVGMIKIKAGSRSMHVEKQWSLVPVAVHATPEYETNVWVRDISASGFTIYVSDPPTEDVWVRWSAFFIE